MPFLLESKSASGSRLLYAIGGKVITIGRAPESGIVIGDHTASKAHAELFPTAQGVVLRDLGSRNGTYVNGMRVAERLLCEGDEIRIATAHFRFASENPSPGPAVTPMHQNVPTIAYPRPQQPAGAKAAPAASSAASSSLQIDQLWAILRLTHTVNEPIELMSGLLHHLLDLVSADRGSVMVVEEDGRNPSLRIDGDREGGAGRESVELDSAPVRRAASEQGPVLAAAGPGPGAPARHILALPIRTPRGLTGLAALDRAPDRPPFTPQEARLAELAAGIAAGAIFSALVGES